MDLFKKESQIYKAFDQEFNVTKKFIGMTDEIENELEMIKQNNFDTIDGVNTLCFVHKWCMEPSYKVVCQKIKENLFMGYKSVLLGKICDDIWSDIFKTERDMYHLVSIADLNLISIAHMNNCEWNSSSCALAARNGNIEILKYLFEHGCPWDETTCSSAAYGNNLNCLKYARENGCPWDIWTCSNAAFSNDIVCLRYAHENGCPWDEWTCQSASATGNLDCLKYAYENGCPIDEWAYYHAVENGCTDCVNYVKNIMFID